MALYLRLLMASVRARLQYKWDFIISTFFYALLSAGDFLTVAAIVFRYPRLGGWNLYEIALLSGVANASFGLFRTFGAEVYSFERYLVSGEFDGLLIRPWPTLASLLARNFDFGRIGALLQGWLVLAIGLKGVLAAGAPWWIVPYTFVLPVAGMGIIGACSIITGAIGFFIIRIDELAIFTVNAPYTASNYPVNIYPAWMRRLLTMILPTAMVAYVPMTYALGKGGSPLWLAAPYATAVVALVVAVQVWRWGERHYQSTGN